MPSWRTTEGTVWAGAPGMLCSIRGGKTECHSVNGSLGTGLYYLYGNRGGCVTSLYEDSDHRLWAGTELGLWQWSPGPPRRYLAEPIDSQQAMAPGDRASGLVFISGLNNIVRQLSGDKIEEYPLRECGPFRPLICCVIAMVLCGSGRTIRGSCVLPGEDLPVCAGRRSFRQSRHRFF